MFGEISGAFRLLLTGNREVFFLTYSTLRFAALSLLTSGIIGVPVAFGISVGNFRGKGVLLVLINSLMAVPTVVIGLMVFYLFSRSGLFPHVRVLFTPVAVVIGQSILILPVMISLMVNGLSRLDESYWETLYTLNIRNRWLYTFLEGRDAILHAMLVGFARVAGEVGISMMLGGNIRWYTRTLTTAIVLETGKGEFELALALGLTLLCVALSVNIVSQVVVRYSRTGRRVHI